MAEFFLWVLGTHPESFVPSFQYFLIFFGIALHASISMSSFPTNPEVSDWCF